MRSGLALLLLVAGATAVQAQNSPEEQARRLLEDGRAYWSRGQHKQALDNFNTIVTGFSGTASVDDALLEIGRYRLEVEDDAEKAREQFSEVARRYPQSDGAPGAYYYLGWLTMARSSSLADIDDALAQFDRLRTLYPRSDWVSKALFAAGLAHRKAGRLPEALDFERRVSLEYPTSDAAPPAQFQIGHLLALMGEPRQAMEEFQQVRNRFPDSEWAARALERSTALYRLYGGEKPAFQLDPAYSVGAGDVLKDVSAILMTPAGTLWIASDKSRSIVPYDAANKMGVSLAAEEPRSLSLGPRGELLAVAKLAARIGAKEIKSFAVPSDKPGVPEQLESLSAAVLTPGGSLLVADDKKNRVYRYSAKYDYVGPFPDARERKVSRMTVDGEGGIVLLDREERSVRVYDESGKPLRGVGGKGGGFELRRPVDVAVDAVRNLYIADEEAGVLVVSPQGKLLASITGPELRRPRALTLDATGAVLVYDDKAQRVLRFR